MQGFETRNGGPLARLHWRRLAQGFAHAGGAFRATRGGGGLVNLVVVNLAVGNLAETRNKERDMEHAKHRGMGGQSRSPWIWRGACGGQSETPNSIAFGSAPRREAVSQLDRPAVSQTETHSLDFLSVADTGPSSGENGWSQNWQWLNGEAGDHRLFGPVRTPVRTTGHRRRRRRPPTRIRNANQQVCSWGRYYSTGGECNADLSPIAWSLLS